MKFIFIPGHMQQGASPSPFDRNLGTKLGSQAVEWFAMQLANGISEVVVMGIVKRSYKITPIQELVPDTDFEYV